MESKQAAGRGELPCALTKEERDFLHMVHDPVSRQRLLGRLQDLGLLAAFLEAESGTT